MAAQAQVFGFSGRQQAALYLYNQQIQNQNRFRQQQQLRTIQRAFVNQRQTIERNQRINQRQIEEILTGVDPYDPKATQQDVARTRRGTAVFGDAHFGSAMFNRTEPYYDYAFISRRNRQVPIGIGTVGNNSIPSSGFGGLLIGGGFGTFAVPY
jgi:hypothetical protein